MFAHGIVAGGMAVAGEVDPGIWARSEAIAWWQEGVRKHYP